MRRVRVPEARAVSVAGCLDVCVMPAVNAIWAPGRIRPEDDIPDQIILKDDQGRLLRLCSGRGKLRPVDTGAQCPLRVGG